MRIKHTAALIGALVVVGTSAFAQAPRRTGAQIVDLLKTAPEGRAMVQKAGIATAVVQAGSAGGWPATFDVTEDFTATMDHTVAVSGHSVEISTSVTNGSVNQFNQKVAVHLEALAPNIGGQAMLTFGNLPRGQYAVAVDVTGSNGTVSASVWTAGGTFACPASLFAQKDAQGVRTCAFIYSQAKDGMLQFGILATAGYINPQRVTVSRVGP